jgi:two-component system response regulator FixJ
MHKHPAVREEALRAGAHAFVLKDSTCDDLVAAIIEVLSRTGTTSQTPLFSRREMQVLQTVSQGLTSKEIAATLQVGVKTIETYRERLMRKSGARNSAELARFAMEIGAC